MSKAQVWYIDYMFAILIFIVAIVIYYQVAPNVSYEETKVLDDLMADAKTMSNSLVSAGYPETWDESDVVRIGITDGSYVLDDTKVINFINLTQERYERTKLLLGTNFDYIIFFEDKNNNLLYFNGTNTIGKAGINSTNLNEKENPDRIITMPRFLIYKHDNKAELVKMVIYVWE